MLVKIQELHLPFLRGPVLLVDCLPAIVETYEHTGVERL